MKSAKYFTRLFGHKAGWVSEIELPKTQSKGESLAMVIYALAVSESVYEFGKLVNDLVIAFRKVANKQSLWNAPQGFAIVRGLSTIFNDDLGDDAPLKSLHLVKVGTSFIQTEYISEFGTMSMGANPGDAITLTGDDVRDILHSF